MLFKLVEDVFWGGYFGYFVDFDGYLWEVVWNLYWELDDIGVIIFFGQFVELDFRKFCVGINCGLFVGLRLCYFEFVGQV